jgi:hypothetical protein
MACCRAVASAVPTPLLAIVGEATTPFMIETAHALAGAARTGRSLVLKGQGHDIDPEAVGPVIEEFLGAPINGTLLAAGEGGGDDQGRREAPARVAREPPKAVGTLAASRTIVGPLMRAAAERVAALSG